MVGDAKQFEKYWTNAKNSLRTKKFEYTVAEDTKKDVAANVASQASLLSASSAAAMLCPTATDIAATSVSASNSMVSPSGVSASSLSGLTESGDNHIPPFVNN